jgi:hypothetical protein
VESLSTVRYYREMLPKHSGDLGYTIKGLFLKAGAGDHGGGIAAIDDDAGRRSLGSLLCLWRAQKGTQTYTNSVLLSLALRPKPS